MTPAGIINEKWGRLEETVAPSEDPTPLVTTTIRHALASSRAWTLCALLLFGSRMNAGPILQAHLVMSVNGERLLVRNAHEPIHLVRGDTLIIHEAWIPHPDHPVPLAVDFRGVVTATPGSDMGVTIDTRSDLLPAFSVDGRGQAYRLAVRARPPVRIPGAQLPSFIIIIEDPRVDYLLVEVAGRLEVLRDGVPVFAGPDDPIKVVEVASNVSNVADILLTIDSPNPPMSKSPYELSLTRSGIPLAQFPVRM